MSRLPLLIGVSGKRKFDDHDLAKDVAIARAVRASFDRIFEKLDHDYPHTPKILLTGAAFGTDLIAAQAALKRRSEDHTGWAVVALLPFEREEFRKDFDHGPTDPPGLEWAKRFGNHKADFDALIGLSDEDEKTRATAPRVVVRELPKLLTAPPVEGHPQPDALTVQQLEGRSNALRDAHYEQVGQFIAESVVIMIAVTKANEKADRDDATGGTNRIVAYRRAGHDAVGANVAAKSLILRRTIREPIAPPARFVWLIDPYDMSGTAERHDYPVTPLEPFFTHATAENYANATSVKTNASRERRLATSLLLLRRLDRFNTDVATGRDLVANVSPIAPEALTHELKQVTEVISNCQIVKNRRAKRSFWVMAILFVCAVFSFEIFAKFFNQEPVALAVYLVILTLITQTWMVARQNYWHLDSEDYRAVAEMLRVQHAWWCAGLEERADREHLQGASNDLVPVRYAGTAIIAWALIRSGWTKPQADWSAVRGSERGPRKMPLAHGAPKFWIVRKLMAFADKLRGSVPDTPSDWIGDQLGYFARKAPDREDKVRISEAASWTLFATSGFLGVLLCLLLIEGSLFHTHVGFHMLKAASSWPDRFLVPLTGHHLSPVGWAALAVLAICARIWLRRVKRWMPLAFSFTIAVTTAVLLTLSSVAAAPKLITMFRLKFDEIHAGEAGMIVWLVGLSALAGAWRYLTERLNIEAEAHDYRDAHGRFDRAEHLLAADLDEHGRLRDEDRARAIVRELGRLALAENEAWLKSRRERPLTPVLG